VVVQRSHVSTTARLALSFLDIGEGTFDCGGNVAICHPLQCKVVTCTVISLIAGSRYFAFETAMTGTCLIAKKQNCWQTQGNVKY
jgi:hypothetical protein